VYRRRSLRSVSSPHVVAMWSRLPVTRQREHTLGALVGDGTVSIARKGAPTRPIVRHLCRWGNRALPAESSGHNWGMAEPCNYLREIEPAASREHRNSIRFGTNAGCCVGLECLERSDDSDAHGADRTA
jgi:hypothetical protein